MPDLTTTPLRFAFVRNISITQASMIRPAQFPGLIMLLTLVTMVALIGGCGGPASAPRQVDAPTASAPLPRRVLTLGEGDSLRAVYFKQVAIQPDAYRLAAGDEFKVVVENRPEYGFSGMALPDGTATLPLLGAVPVVGRSVPELLQELTARYRTHLNDARVDLLVLRAQVQLDQLYQSLVVAGARDDRANEYTIIDGRIHLPLVGMIDAEGRTVPEVEADLAAAYAKVSPGLGVSLILGHRRTRFVGVFGEVRQAGRFPFDRPLSLMAAIAQAGGFNDRAQARQVVLAVPNGPRSMAICALDLDQSLAGNGSAGWMSVIDDDSIVFVPRTGITNLNLFVQQYIRGLLPIDVNYSLVDPVNLIKGH